MLNVYTLIESLTVAGSLINEYTCFLIGISVCFQAGMDLTIHKSWNKLINTFSIIFNPISLSIVIYQSHKPIYRNLNTLADQKFMPQLAFLQLEPIH